MNLNSKSLYTHSYSDKGFTLAETLITLVIIGVVAAVTVPVLMNNSKEKEFNTAKNKARATIGEAFRLATLANELPSDLSADEFAKNVLPKYLKITKHCSSATECGFSDSIKRADGSAATIPSTWSALTKTTGIVPELSYTTQVTPVQSNAAYFLTLDGFHVTFLYNPNCAISIQDKTLTVASPYSVQTAYDITCFNAIYDMNGNKGPNQVGKDIGFVGSFYNGAGTQTRAILPHNEQKNNVTWDQANEFCQSLDGDNWALPDINELSLMYVNAKLLTSSIGNIAFWSSTPMSKYFSMYRVFFGDGCRYYAPRTKTYYVRCVRK